MISSNTRASRSRFSSPSRSLEAKSSAANEGSKTFMQRWLEPSVQSKASFEEAGLMRYGVLETMAPLGTLPKPKKTGGESGPGHQPVRKIILRPSGSSHAANHQDDQTAHRTRPRAPSPPLPQHRLLPRQRHRTGGDRPPRTLKMRNTTPRGLRVVDHRGACHYLPSRHGRTPAPARAKMLLPL